MNARTRKRAHDQRVTTPILARRRANVDRWRARRQHYRRALEFRFGCELIGTPMPVVFRDCA